MYMFNFISGWIKRVNNREDNYYNHNKGSKSVSGLVSPCPAVLNWSGPDFRARPTGLPPPLAPNFRSLPSKSLQWLGVWVSLTAKVFCTRKISNFSSETSGQPRTCASLANLSSSSCAGPAPPWPASRPRGTWSLQITPRFLMLWLVLRLAVVVR